MENIKCSECGKAEDVKQAREYTELAGLLAAYHSLETSGDVLLCPAFAAAVCGDLRGETVKVEPIYTCPTCGAFHEDGGRGKPPVYCDECGADWKP